MHEAVSVASPNPPSSVASRVAAQIREMLANGVRPWTPPWSSADALALPLRANGLAYRGVNILVLWAAAQSHGYKSRQWFSFRQAKELGGSVRRGERATPVIFYAPADVAGGEPAVGDSAATLEAQKGRRAVLRSFSVFNADQIDGLPDGLRRGDAGRVPSESDVALIERLDPLFARVPADVRHGGARACYAPDDDIIYLPPREAFHTAPQYFATRAHELAHWTAHPTRLDRELASRMTPMAYAREELVAELAAAFLGAELGLAPDHVEDHAAYLDHWLKLLDREPGALFAASGKAQAVVDYLRPWLLDANGEVCAVSGQ